MSHSSRPQPPQRARDTVAIDADSAATDSGARAISRGGAEQRAMRRPRRARLGVITAIALGGALGTPARYSITQLIDVAPDGFPWATFWINISGSFALGVVLIVVLERFPATRYVRPFVATGFLGAFTTYSTFAVETDLLVKNGRAAIAAVYALGSLLAGFGAVWAGIALGRQLPVGKGDRR